MVAWGGPEGKVRGVKTVLGKGREGGGREHGTVASESCCEESEGGKGLRGEGRDEGRGGGDGP